MFSNSHANIGIIAILLTCCFSIREAVADAVLTQDYSTYGNIISSDETNIAFAEGCDKKLIKTIPWKSIKYLVFNSQCTPQKVRLPSAGVDICDEQPKLMYKVYLNQDEKPPLYASQVILDKKGVIHIVSPDGLTLLHGAKQEVKGIEFGLVCPGEIPENLEKPESFCMEPKKWAVNLNLEPVFNNLIFTKGFTFYFEIIDDEDASERSSIPDDVGELVRSAFQNAIMDWSTILYQKKDELDVAIKNWLGTAVSSSERFRLFVPPQVVQVQCPNSAVFIVKWYVARNTIFPKITNNRGKLARAQIEGRTILINGLDYTYANRLDVVRKKDGTVNLSAVLAHELGHAFGLLHNNELNNDQTFPLMAQKLYTINPTANDEEIFIRVLSENVQGKEPGVFNQSECPGVELP